MTATLTDPASAADNPIIVALDVSSAADARRLVRELSGSVGAFKVGLELFNAEGPSIFDALRQAAGEVIRIFYDAKFHDIPNTVAGAVASAARHGLWMVNIHAGGGTAMMRSAVRQADASAADAGGAPPIMIAVTVLTSIDAQTLADELGVSAAPQEQVVRLARLAQDSGCGGVVASPLEVPAIRAACGPEFLIVTPGVRPAGADIGDQKRVMTPAEAVRQGSSYLVIGRPIVAAPSPRSAAEAILSEIRSAQI